MAVDEARNHHWVPQCYLRGFAKSPSKNAKLYVVDLHTWNAFVTTPRNVAAARDFNRINSAGFDPNYIESRYAVFEGQLSQALKRMWDSGQFSDSKDLNLICDCSA